MLLGICTICARVSSLLECAADGVPSPPLACREIPPLPWYRQTFPQMVMAGFLPFSAIYIELYYIFASVWGHKVGGPLDAGVMALCPRCWNWRSYAAFPCCLA